MSKSVLVVLLTLCAACQARMPTPAVTTEISPYVAPSVTPDCQPASGVTVEIRPVSNTAVGLVAKGLQPGEVPSVFYSTEVNGVGSKRGEAWGFAKGADQNGNFSTELTGLVPVEGQGSATWDIRLVHRRGVACAQVTLP